MEFAIKAPTEQARPIASLKCITTETDVTSIITMFHTWSMRIGQMNNDLTYKPAGIILDGCKAEMSAACNYFNGMSTVQYIIYGWESQFQFDDFCTLIMRCTFHIPKQIRYYR